MREFQVSEYTVDTPLGPARAQVTSGVRPRRGGGRPTVLVLGHGAGGGIDARDLVALDAALPARGITVVRVTQPWRVAGRKVAGPPAQLDIGWTAVLMHLATALPELAEGGAGGGAGGGARLVVGGRSAGARVACRTARAVGAAGVVALAFPLHPPGRPERSRVDELTGAGVPTVVVQGERDAFGGPPEFPAGTEFVALAGADHSFKVPARGSVTQAQTLDLVVEGVAAWLARLA